jgi:hypothetical protein
MITRCACCGARTYAGERCRRDALSLASVREREERSRRRIARAAVSLHEDRRETLTATIGAHLEERSKRRRVKNSFASP